MELRDYQLNGIAFGKSILMSQRGTRAILASPTGSGKSFVELALLESIPNSWLVTPRLEIAKSILEKLGAPTNTLAELVDSCWKNRIVTPIRFLNSLTRGNIQQVSAIIFDEGHHVLTGTWERIQLLCGMPPALLLTATPYRGTARGTAAFLNEWGRPTWMITLREAAARKVITVPKCDVMPLVDDDEISLNSTGDFDVVSTSSAYTSRLDDLAKESMRWHNVLWDKPTIFALPSTELAYQLTAKLQRYGAGAIAITAKTSRSDRNIAIQAMLDCAAAICQVSVLGEGVDFPVCRIIDAKPCQSPVAWMQLIGRATRPGLSTEYIATNRNLGRHAYLFEGLLPPSAVSNTDKVFNGPSRRSGYRALGLEAIGRFSASTVKLLDGCNASIYFLTNVNEGRIEEYACFVHPASSEAVWAHRQHRKNQDGTKAYGRWIRCGAPAELRGFASVPSMAPTEKMLAWWKRAASSYGLDPEQHVTRKNFAALPFLSDLNLRVKS